MSPEKRALLRAAGIPNIPGDGIARRVAVAVVVGGIQFEETMDADIVATAGNDGVGSEEGTEASAAAAEPDDAFRRGDNSSQTRSKRRRISRPAPQQKEDAMITSAAVESPWLQWLEDDEEASRAAQSADAAFGPLKVDVDAPPVAPDDGKWRRASWVIRVRSTARARHAAGTPFAGREYTALASQPPSGGSG